MAKPELGSKQICTKCSAKFYDLTRRPAVCPKCGNSFDPEEALKTRRGRPSAVPDYESEDEKPPAAPVEPEGYEDEVDDTPEIDAAPEADVLETDDDGNSDPTNPTGPVDDIGVDFAEDDPLAEDADDDVPFLEDEDDDFADDEIEGLPSPDDDLI